MGRSNIVLKKIRIKTFLSDSGVHHTTNTLLWLSPTRSIDLELLLEEGPPRFEVARPKAGVGERRPAAQERDAAHFRRVAAAVDKERGDDACAAWMDKGSENGDLGTAWLQGHGLSVGSEALGLSS